MLKYCMHYIWNQVICGHELARRNEFKRIPGMLKTLIFLREKKKKKKTNKPSLPNHLDTLSIILKSVEFIFFFPLTYLNTEASQGLAWKNTDTFLATATLTF